jgi:hypothetical protein
VELVQWYLCETGDLKPLLNLFRKLTEAPAVQAMRAIGNNLSTVHNAEKILTG